MGALRKENIMIERRCIMWGNGIPCVYIAIEQKDSDRIRVKVGLSRSMGRRRRAISYHYRLRTIYEEYAIDEKLEAIEMDLIRWLWNAPTAESVSYEVVRVDYHIAEMLVDAFPTMVDNLNHYYRGA